MSLDIRSLSYFVEVAHQGSFTKAAQQINISQPALSKCVSSLEAELGINLFVRDHGNLYLTELGKDILDSAENLLIHFDSIQDKFNTIRQKNRNSLSIGCSSLLSSIFGSDLCVSFITQQDDITCSYSEGPVGTLIEQVFRMEVDIAVCMLCRRDYEYMDRVTVEPFYQGSFIAALLQDEDGECESFGALPVQQKNLVTTAEVASAPANDIQAQWRSVFFEDRISAIRRKVVENRFVGLVPDIARQNFPQQVDFLNLPTPPKYEIAFVTKKNVSVPKNVKALKKYITMNFMNQG